MNTASLSSLDRSVELEKPMIELIASASGEAIDDFLPEKLKKPDSLNKNRVASKWKFLAVGIAAIAMVIIGGGIISRFSGPITNGNGIINKTDAEPFGALPSQINGRHKIKISHHENDNLIKKTDRVYATDVIKQISTPGSDKVLSEPTQSSGATADQEYKEIQDSKSLSSYPLFDSAKYKMLEESNAQLILGKDEDVRKIFQQNCLKHMSGDKILKRDLDYHYSELKQNYIVNKPENMERILSHYARHNIKSGAEPLVYTEDHSNRLKKKIIEKWPLLERDATWFEQKLGYGPKILDSSVNIHLESAKKIIGILNYGIQQNIKKSAIRHSHVNEFSEKEWRKPSIVNIRGIILNQGVSLDINFMVWQHLIEEGFLIPFGDISRHDVEWFDGHKVMWLQC